MKTQSIAIIDYGMGNLRSVEKAFHKVGALGAFVTDDPKAVVGADKAVLPGDGAFDSTMRSLQESGVAELTREFVALGRPFLGICVGMQVLLSKSEEGDPGVAGLSLVPGKVKKFAGSSTVKVPQIGWNAINFVPDCPLGLGIEASEPMAYFLNSFYCCPDNPADIAATTEYGTVFCSAIQHGNIWATQFHPEKSGNVGLQILRNFVSL